MALADFLFVFIGIETPDRQLLLAAGKAQNASDDTMARLRRIRERGLHVIAGLIVGFDGERRDVFDQQRAFVEASGIGIVMFGLLQALPNTQLWRRLRAEGRLLEGQRVHLNHTVEGMNYVPQTELTKREYLSPLIATTHELYEAEAFFRRIVPALLSLRKQVRPPMRRDYLVNFLRLVFQLGVLDRETRRPFWKALVRVARNNPPALGAFYYDCFHFSHLKEHRAAVESLLLGYLADPTPCDVLDDVMPRDRQAEAALPLSARAG